MKKMDSNIQIRIDKKTKKEAKKTLSELGLDFSSAIKMFLKNVVITQSIPFEPKTENGFTSAYEKALLNDLEEAKKNPRTYKTAEELHAAIMAEDDE